MSNKRCCVPECTVISGKVPLHSFPNPEKEPDRFKSWLYNIGGDILALDNQFIYKRRKVCHNHFEKKFHTWTNTLATNAVPTLQLSGFRKKAAKRPLSDVTNVNQGASHQALSEPNEPSTSKGLNQDIPHPLPSTSRGLSEPFTPEGANCGNKNIPHPDMSETCTSKDPRPANVSLKKPTLQKKIRDLQAKLRQSIKKKDNYATRLKKALNLSENKTFQKLLKKFTTLAAMFTVMQFREIPKGKMGRRFTHEEKIMALSLYKQGPRAYRWLSKIFVLPSPLTLRRLLSKAQIKPGINKNIFSQLKIRANSMNQDDKLCILLFDEIAISPHFDYNCKKDLISGFVTNGYERKRKIADHALVFMLRGVIKNYKQPLAYTFCHGSTPKIEIKLLIKNIIIELKKCGFTVLATLCDQGSTNVSAINSLIQDTRAEYLRKNLTYEHDTFEVNGEEIIPLFDPPHLIKGIRNNLITKNLKCTIEGGLKIAKWEHIVQLYEENPAYKGIRLIKNLTETHVNPKQMCKMKVKYATQIFSKTVATNMGYLASKGILPQECQDTADVLMFFDDLFDSMNGSFDNSKKRSGKKLLGPVTPKSDHRRLWKQAKEVLKSMKFVTKEGRESAVPSVNNWIRTLENTDRLIHKIFNKYSFKSIWMRHFNQDPLENFFGCIRSHGCRNNSPTPSGFETAFASLLITNVVNHSRGSNCEEDFCKAFASMKKIFISNDQAAVEHVEVDFEDLNCEIIDFKEKSNNPKIIAQLCYVTGYILRQTKKNVFKNCKVCNENLYNNTNPNEYLIRREYFMFKKSLTYPSEELLKCFSGMQDIITMLIEKKSDYANLKNYCNVIIATLINFNFINCKEHRAQITKFISNLTCRFFLYNWCRDVNKILNGTRAEKNDVDTIKKQADDYYKRKNKN